MTNDLHDFQTTNEHLTELNKELLADVIRFEGMSVPIGDDVLIEIEAAMLKTQSYLIFAEDKLDFSTDENELLNSKELQLSMQKIYHRLLWVVNNTLNPYLHDGKTSQKEFDKYLKYKVKHAKREKKTRQNIRDFYAKNKSK